MSTAPDSLFAVPALKVAGRPFSGETILRVASCPHIGQSSAEAQETAIAANARHRNPVDLLGIIRTYRTRFPPLEYREREAESPGYCAKQSHLTLDGALGISLNFSARRWYKDRPVRVDGAD